MTNDTMKALEWFNRRIEYFAVKHPQEIKHVDTIRAVLSPVDVEKIKQDVCNMIGGHHTRATHEAVREAIDYLSQRGVLK